jgi:glutamate---cysteine ligase / carboxylate-amine ligase
MDAPSLTMGIEEEYLLVDRESRNLVRDPPAALMSAMQAALGSQVTSEFLKSQIEVGTKVCTGIDEARAELKRLRATVAEIADGFGFAPIASSTHPFSHWDEQEHTRKDRYDALARDLAGAARRMVISGMHVHVGIEDDDLRIDLMNQVRYFLPHLLALSTSSPFWQGEDMGMQSYRLTIWDALPRTGLPDTFDGYSEFQRLVRQLVETGIIPDSTMIWWDIRPSGRFPTLESRITDISTRLEDGLAIAATYQALLSMLYRLRQKNQRWRLYPGTLMKENRWRAQRYGVTGELIDFGKGALTSFSNLCDEIVEMTAEDAARLGSQAEVAHIKTIAERGTSADEQRRVFNQCLAEGADARDALNAVVDYLVEETVADL